jgi:signal transduction histidine kinase
VEKAKLHAFKSAGVYLAIGAIWIALSDRLLLALVHGDIGRLSSLQTAKGWFYVGSTAILFYLVRLGILRRLQRTQRQLQRAQTIDALGRMSAGITHDFRNILTVIEGNVELATLKLGPYNPASECLAEIAAMSRKGQALVSGLMAFARGKEPELRPLELGALVLDLEPMLKKMLPPTVLLQVKAPREGAAILGDPARLEQALLNMVGNAADALKLAKHSSFVAVTVKAGVSHVSLSVRDNGSGIDPALADRVFEPFFSTKPEGQGTGLGLATVHSLVSELKGDIDLESEPGAGTEIVMRFPKGKAF